MVSIELERRAETEPETEEVFIHKDGFAVVVMTEVIHDAAHFLFAESSGSFPRPVSTPVDGWRIYFAKKDLKKAPEEQLDVMLPSSQWFALHRKGIEVVGVYSPQSLYSDGDRKTFTLLLHAVDAYCRSTGAVVDVPDSSLFQLTDKQNVSNPYSGRPEFCVDLVIRKSGWGKINGMRVRE